MKFETFLRTESESAISSSSGRDSERFEWKDSPIWGFDQVVSVYNRM